MCSSAEYDHAGTSCPDFFFQRINLCLSRSLVVSLSLSLFNYFSSASVRSRRRRGHIHNGGLSIKCEKPHTASVTNFRSSYERKIKFSR